MEELTAATTVQSPPLCPNTVGRCSSPSKGAPRHLRGRATSCRTLQPPTISLSLTARVRVCSTAGPRASCATCRLLRTWVVLPEAHTASGQRGVLGLRGLVSLRSRGTQRCLTELNRPSVRTWGRSFPFRYFLRAQPAGSRGTAATSVALPST